MQHRMTPSTLSSPPPTNDGVRLGDLQALRFKGLLDAARVPAQLHIAPGSHDWSYVATQYPEMFSFLATYWRRLGR